MTKNHEVVILKNGKYCIKRLANGQWRKRNTILKLPQLCSREEAENLIKKIENNISWSNLFK